MLLNFDGKTFLLKLQLHEELSGRSVDGRGILPGPNFWLRAMHKVVSVVLSKAICHAVGCKALS